MTNQPLEYASTDLPRQRRWPWGRILFVGVVLVVVVSIPTITVRQVESRIDAVTGSISWKTVWLFGFTSDPRIDASPLEHRLKNSGIAWTPSWQFLHNTHHTVFGRARAYECGVAPPIHDLRPLLGGLAAASTDAELREFVRVMQTGTEAQVKSGVEAASHKAARRLGIE